GLPPLEAMACGTPVLASSAASLPEALGAGAVFFDPNNADDLKRKMEQVLGDELMRKRMIITGLEHVKQFSLRRMADDFLSILRSG
ncbi:MAG TPA: glycosyltransferase, partial [bacterium]|nr:glycosyltransferase [bacterium]